jgi:uncharacterized protein (TIGR02453 family)
MSFDHFGPETFDFLRDLSANNTRAWFDANKPRYEAHYLQPGLALVEAMRGPIQRVSPGLIANASRTGGSFMRIYRDTRFAKDKTPYKTNLGLHFRSEVGEGIHAPGVYLHVGLDGVFVGIGTWQPPAPTLAAIRDRIVEEADRWARITTAPAVKKHLKFYGESLVRPPKGYDPNHPHIADLRRKDFILTGDLSEADATQPGFLKKVTKLCELGREFYGFLEEAALAGAESGD